MTRSQAIPPTTDIAAPARPAATVRASDYAQVGGALALFGAVLVFVTQTRQGAITPDKLMGPMVALAGLTGVVWLMMVLVRNISVIRGIASSAYYADYKSKPPPEWVERPARTFDNLLQVPILFYVVSLLMLVSGHADAAQLALAWVFVGVRVLHALIYIGWNYVPYRFCAWMAGCITLVVIWVRFAVQLS